jgi:hypothetical protein
MFRLLRSSCLERWKATIKSAEMREDRRSPFKIRTKLTSLSRLIRRKGLISKYLFPPSLSLLQPSGSHLALAGFHSGCNGFRAFSPQGGERFWTVRQSRTRFRLIGIMSRVISFKPPCPTYRGAQDRASTVDSVSQYAAVDRCLVN